MTVSVSDGNGGTDSIGVTITVTDVNEQPGRPAAPSVGATANSDTSLDVSWAAPGLNGGPAITGYNLQYRQGTSGSFTNGPQNVSGTSAMITGLTAGTSYQVQVRALNGETPSDWSPAGTGSSSTPAQPTLTLDVDPNRFSEDAGTVTICVVPSAVSSQREASRFRWPPRTARRRLRTTTSRIAVRWRSSPNSSERVSPSRW